MLSRRKKLLPFLNNRKDRILFRLINIYLIIGIAALLITIFYLMAHLYQSDSLIKYCIPGFILGLSSIIIYFAGYHSLIKDHPGKSRLYQHNI